MLFYHDVVFDGVQIQIRKKRSALYNCNSNQNQEILIFVLLNENHHWRSVWDAGADDPPEAQWSLCSSAQSFHAVLRVMFSFIAY